MIRRNVRHHFGLGFALLLAMAYLSAPVRGQGLSAVASFNGTTTGGGPTAGVTLDAGGNLFGTAAAGGSSNNGTVWEIKTASVPEPSSIVTGLIGLMLTGGFVVAKRAWDRRRS